MAEAQISFRQRFLSGELLLGTFIKTPTTHAIEILGGLGFDFVVIDEEHAPFDRVTIDNLLLAARASNTAGIVRVAEATPAKLLAALDDGAAGVLVPHISTVAKTLDLVAACRYSGGKRGFSNSPRAGGYGQFGIWDHVKQADASVTVIAMIEDPEALDVIDEIISVEGLDGIFIGRGDLTVAMRANGLTDQRVRSAAERIIAAARKIGKPVCILVANAKEAADWRSLGANSFIVASDQGFILVNNAGVSRHRPMLETRAEDFDYVISVNLRAAYFVAKSVAAGMVESGRPGAIIHISSQMGHVGGIDRTVYSASKHAIEGLTKSMAIELGPHGVRVNSIGPTFIKTPLTDSTFADPARRAWIESKIKLGRLGELEDIMGAVVFLASDAAAMITGTSLLIDGGWTAG